MFNHQLTQEQIEFRDTVRDFVTQELKHVARDSTRLQDLTRPLSVDLIDKAARMFLHSGESGAVANRVAEAFAGFERTKVETR